MWLAKELYPEKTIMRAIDHYHRRSPLNLPLLLKILFSYLLVAPFAIRAMGGDFWHRTVLYWIPPTVVIFSFWWFSFQMTPNLKYRGPGLIHALGSEELAENFLKQDFEHIELRRMARLRSGRLALVPETSIVRDRLWRCRGGIVPIVLRPLKSNKFNFKIIGDAFVTQYGMTIDPTAKGVEIRLV
jgi:hypothetical protein